MRPGFVPTLHPHRRHNPLTGRSVLVSPQRNLRPWQGAQEAPDLGARLTHDPGCYLCPGNARAGGVANPSYTGTYVFPNDFPALQPDTPAPANEGGLFAITPARGEARVLCFSEDHSLTLPELSQSALEGVVQAWVALQAELGQRWRSVQLFENKGAMMGCSSPHPHGQVWATDFLPDEVEREDRAQSAYLSRLGRNLLLDYAQLEVQSGERIVELNEHWLAVVPFWAAWPFETLVLPRAHAARMTDLDAARQAALASLLKALTTRYDNLFNCSFPYSMGWHGAPSDAADTQPWLLHAHFYPPLLRSATVRKFMVGFEMLGEAQRDLTPEQAAAQLRATPSVHYRQR